MALFFKLANNLTALYPFTIWISFKRAAIFIYLEKY